MTVEIDNIVIHVTKESHNLNMLFILNPPLRNLATS